MSEEIAHDDTLMSCAKYQGTEQAHLLTRYLPPRSNDIAANLLHRNSFIKFSSRIA